MKTCLNCNSAVRDNDKYCRNCGCKIQSNSKYILINVLIIFSIIELIGLLALFLASYMITK